MTSPLLVVVLTLAAFVATSTYGKDAVKNANVDLAEELRKARQDSATARQESAKLRQDLEKARAETKEIIARENAQLRADADKLKRDADKLKKEDSKIRKENKKLRRQDEELKRKVHKLHKADSEIKSSLRQRDQNNTMELQNIVRNSFRQMDFTSELKKTINEQIQEYLDENRICVGGEIQQWLNNGRRVVKKTKIEFGQTFQRIPTFAAALSTFDCNVRSDVVQSYIYVWDFHVTNSSAAVTIMANYCHQARVNWIACL